MPDDASARAAAEAAPPEAAEPGSPDPAEALRQLSPPPPAGRWRLAALTDPASVVPVYLGVVAVVAGFALLFVAWGAVAGQADVYRQMPYVISAAFPGLGLIMVGLVLINVSVRRQDGARRDRQMAALAEVIAALRRSLDRR